MELALYYRAIMTRLFICLPIVVFITVTYPGDRFSFKGQGQNLLSLHNFLRPALDHLLPTINDALAFAHRSQTSREC